VGAELADFLDEILAAEWPTRDQFRDAGRGALHKALERYGDVDTWKHTVGLNARWEEDRIEASLESYLAGRQSTRWPTRVEFDRDGRRPLLGAIDQHGAGLRYWFDRLADSQLERRLTRLLSGRTTWPTTAEWHRLEALPVLVAVHRHPLGTPGWALRLGLSHPHARARRAPHSEREQGTADRLSGQAREAQVRSAPAR